MEEEYNDKDGWFGKGKLWEFDPAGVLSGKCSKARVERFSFLARACEEGNYKVVKALAMPPYSLNKEDWGKQDGDTSPNVQYICAFSFCYSPRGQNLLKEIINPPWSFTEKEIYDGAFWCFLWDNTSLFESIVGDAAVSISLQRAILNMVTSDLHDYWKGLAYVSGAIMIEHAVSEIGRYGPLFYYKYGYEENRGPLKLTRVAMHRRGYAFFLAHKCHANPDSPMAMLPTAVIGKIANLMVLNNIIEKDD